MRLHSIFSCRVTPDVKIKAIKQESHYFWRQEKFYSTEKPSTSYEWWFVCGDRTHHQFEICWSILPHARNLVVDLPTPFNHPARLACGTYGCNIRLPLVQRRESCRNWRVSLEWKCSRIYLTD